MSLSSHYPPSAEIEINAPLQTVWDLLLDSASYPQWNSFIPEAVGDLKALHTPIHMRVQLGESMTRAVMQSVIVETPANGGALWVHEHASWLAKTALVRSRRHHKLTAINPQQTTYHTWETFSGLFKPFVPFAKIDAGFKTQAADLKTVSEQGD
ncbi:MAG: SRPBCC domain-containing protein [Hyphomonadaceae bacterium]